MHWNLNVQTKFWLERTTISLNQIIDFSSFYLFEGHKENAKRNECDNVNLVEFLKALHFENTCNQLNKDIKTIDIWL